MKKILSLFAGVMMCAATMAQHTGPMAFAGPSRFGVEAMDAWQDNECDTVRLQLNGTTDADIIMPAMTYTVMGLTIPSYTIHGATFSYDTTTRNVVFDEQTYSETIMVSDVEKKITGYSLTASYSHSDKTFSLSTRLSYGNMPVQVTYIIEQAAYVTSTSGIDEVNASQQHQQVFDLSGHRVVEPEAGHFYLINGKKTYFTK